MSITAVFLDLYQTVAYLHPPREERYAIALREFGLEADLATLRRAYLAADHDYTLAGMESPIHLLTDEERRLTYRRFHKVLLSEAGLGHAIDRVDDVYGRYGKLEREMRLFPDVVPALTRLKEDGYRLGMITNVDRDPSENLERLGVLSMFDSVTASCLVDCEKPDGRIFTAALDSLGVPASEAVHVGDLLLADVQGATRAGMKAVLLDRDDLQPGLHRNRVRSLLELPDLLRNGLI